MLSELFRATVKDFLKWVVSNQDKISSAEDSPVPAPMGISIGSGYANQTKAVGGSSLPTTFNFTVTNATGGKVITVRHYDPRTDRSHENVYIITDKEDLGQELGEIITKESLSR